MENNETYCYIDDFLFRTDSYGNDFWVSPRFNDSWQKVDAERGPYPSKRYPKLTKDEALQFAKKLGMSEEAFNQ